MRLETLSQAGPGCHIQQAPPVKRVEGKVVVDGAVFLPGISLQNESREGGLQETNRGRAQTTQDEGGGVGGRGWLKRPV
jgi:hypothetical protein